MSCHPKTGDENVSNSESDGYQTISYAVICDGLSEVIKGEKLPLEVKRAIQVETIQQVIDSEKINVHKEMVDVLSRVTPSMMKKLIKKMLILVRQYTMLILAENLHLVKLEILNQDLCKGISSSLIDWYFTKECSTVYEQDGAKYHQLILPIEFRTQAMELFHNQQGHQAVECMLQLVCEQFYWSTLLQDITNWIRNCKQWQTAKCYVRQCS